MNALVSLWPLVTTLQTKNYAIGLIHEAIIGKTISTTVMPTAVQTIASCIQRCRQCRETVTKMLLPASRLHPPLPPCVHCSQWGTARIHTVRCILTVTSTAGWKGGLLLAEHRLLILIIDHRFYERTSINQCLFNIPTKGNNSHNSNTIHNLNPDPTLPLTV